MASLVIENITEVPPEPPQLARELRARKAPVRTETAAELAVELGIWLSGLESFLAAGHYSFANPDGARTPDTLKELQLTQAALVRCAGLNARLIASDGDAGVPNGRELSILGTALRDLILIGECIVRSDARGIAEWRAWSSTLNARLAHLTAVKKMVGLAETAGEQFLPERLMQIVNDASTSEHAELALVLPKFAKVLKWLSVIEQMLKADEPLKPALLIFSSVSEQVQELINTINNRLERFPNNEAEMFASLDAASYTASIELKKVYSQELAGVARLRPSPSIYARMETAHSLLSDGFQQMLAGFATSVDGGVSVFDLFPNFREKCDQSIILRQELNKLAALVGDAEKDPAPKKIEKLHASLRGFMDKEIRYLFYKDSETVERFVEEILVTKQNKDLVPILHRFGAYLDTLFGQVCLRAVLANHPFED